MLLRALVTLSLVAPAAAACSSTDPAAPPTSAPAVAQVSAVEPDLVTIEIVDIVLPELAAEQGHGPDSLLVGGAATVRLAFVGMDDVTGIEGALLLQDEDGANNRIVTVNAQVVTSDGSFEHLEPIDLDLLGPVRVRATGSFVGTGDEFEEAITIEIEPFEPPAPSNPADEWLLVEDSGVRVLQPFEMFIPAADDLILIPHNTSLLYELKDPEDTILQVSVQSTFGKTLEEYMETSRLLRSDLALDEPAQVLGSDGWLLVEEHPDIARSTISWFAFRDGWAILVILSTPTDSLDATFSRGEDILASIAFP